MLCFCSLLCLAFSFMFILHVCIGSAGMSQRRYLYVTVSFFLVFISHYEQSVDCSLCLCLGGSGIPPIKSSVLLLTTSSLPHIHVYSSIYLSLCISCFHVLVVFLLLFSLLLLSVMMSPSSHKATSLPLFASTPVLLVYASSLPQSKRSNILLTNQCVALVCYILV